MVVVFISAEYAARDWTRIERRGQYWPGRCGNGVSTCCRPGSMTPPCPGCCRTWYRSICVAGLREQFAAMIADKLATLGIPAPGTRPR